MITLLLIFLIAFCYSFFIQKEKPKYLSLQRTDILKAIFPFVIIIHHISFRTTEMPLMDFRYTGPYVVGIFFYLSGYGLEYKYQKGNLVLKDLGKRLKVLLIPLLLPLFIYSLLTLPFQENIVQHIYMTVKEVNFYLPCTWFIVILLWLYVAYYCLRTQIRSFSLFIVAIMCFLLVLMGVLYKIGATGTCYVSNFAFLLGILGQQVERKYLLGGGKYLLMLSLLLLVVISFAYVRGFPPFQGFALLGVSLFVPSFFIVYQYVEVPFNNHTCVRFFKNLSYEMYLCQGISFWVLDRIGVSNLMYYTIACLLFNTGLAVIVKGATQRLFYRTSSTK